MLKEPLEKSRELAQAVLERGQWPKLYFTKNGEGWKIRAAVTT